MQYGILCMNKPKGFTSFDVIAKLRGILKIKRLGHSGTLDPMATGVLPIFIGTATKCCDIIPNDNKSYIANFRLGATTNTQDSTGTIIKEYPYKDIQLQDILTVSQEYIGDISQIPPMYSAVSINGKRLYELARKNVVVDRPSRIVTVHTIKVLAYDRILQTGTLQISCGKGTYIRTIINDIGKSLNTGAYMTSLVRTSANGFTLDDCHTFNKVEEAVSKGTIDSLIIPTERLFENLPKIHLNESQTKRYRNGAKLLLDDLDIQSTTIDYTIYSHDGTFLGTAKSDLTEGVLRVGKNF